MLRLRGEADTLRFRKGSVLSRWGFFLCTHSYGYNQSPASLTPTHAHVSHHAPQIGSFLCNRCFGLHRAVGAHVTRVKCIGLDAWHPDEVELLKVGNRGRFFFPPLKVDLLVNVCRFRSSAR